MKRWRQGAPGEAAACRSQGPAPRVCVSTHPSPRSGPFSGFGPQEASKAAAQGQGQGRGLHLTRQAQAPAPPGGPPAWASPFSELLPESQSSPPWPLPPSQPRLPACLPAPCPSSLDPQTHKQPLPGWRSLVAAVAGFSSTAECRRGSPGPPPGRTPPAALVLLHSTQCPPQLSTA